MKKRAMKKYIPYGFYCYGKIEEIFPNGKGFRTTGTCKNLVKHKLVNDYMIIPKELGSEETKKVSVQYWTYRCRYTGVSTEDDALLYDSCKICGIKEPKVY